ncbi:MAG: Arc family DNA-binding protein [Ignavibacteriae bacterium]|nr:Arc family DNA-binding protein [Ignavibacteriota bacterium]
MSEKKKFLLRLESDVYTALEKWAADDLRSVNAQMEFLLRTALKKAGRLNTPDAKSGSATDSGEKGNTT